MSRKQKVLICVTLVLFSLSTLIGVPPFETYESLAATKAEKVTLKVGRTDYAAHGTKAFANATVLMSGDKIVAASLDEYQFMAKETSVGVPNSDADFGKNYADDTKVLASKLTNAEAYSANMAKAGSTVAINKNFNAIEAYVSGKTIAELEQILSTKSKEEMVDVVTSATLVDTYGYVQAIVEAAKLAKDNGSVQVDASVLDNITVARTTHNAHGTKAFADAVVFMADDKVIAASLDEYQFMAKETSVGVPNSDADFGKNYADDTKVLASKLTNAEAYSANMAKAGSTVAINKNFNAIEAYVSGKTIAELEETLSTKSKEEMVDVVTSATLVDTYGYVEAIVKAAKIAEAKENKIKVGRVDYAAHGTKAFANAVVVMKGDIIIAASLDEYQFMAKETSVGVPNSDADFGKNYADDTKVLASKLTNAEAYSANMAKAGSTVTIDKNFNAIEKYVVGKTIAELEQTLSTKSKEEMVDVVTSATLVDTYGYVQAIVEAAKIAK